MKAFLVRALTYLKKTFISRRTLYFFLLSAPILLFCLGFLQTGNLVAPGDADYLLQTQEAMRRSILEFHQFPWWNPWVSGGVPLFANPQFGLISIATPLTLLFGAVMGYKLALFACFVIGFWGLFLLFRRVFHTPIARAIMLGYIWTFGTFLTQRLSGHYTFFVIQFFPWALMYYLRRREDKWAWLKLSLVISFMALTAAHNMTILSYIVIGFVVLFEGIRLKRDGAFIRMSFQFRLTDLYFWLKAGALFILLTGYRLFYTLQYMHDYPRLETNNPEPTIGVLKALFGMFGPLRQFVHTPSTPQWSWLEVSAYIGIFTGVAALCIFIILVRRRHEASKLFSYSPTILIALLITFFVLGLGGFMGKYSPYLLLRDLPILSSMRVATRWIPWCSMFILIFIAAYKGPALRKLLNIFLLISCIELFFYTRPYLAKPYFLPNTPVRSASAPFEQKRLYDTQRGGVPYDEDFTNATENNYGQIIAGDSLIDTRWAPPLGVTTKRCSIDEGCNYVLTNNAKVTYWSPDKVVLERTAPGKILLDANPGRYWKVNGVYTFLSMKVVDPSKDFLITTPSKTITLQYVPKYSIEWALGKL